MSNVALVWLGFWYDILSVFHSSTLPHNPALSSNLEWQGGRGIHRPRHQSSYWAKAAESSTIGWSDAMLFPTSVHPVLLAVVFHPAWPLTQNIQCIDRRIVSLSNAEELASKTLLLASSRPSDELMQFIWCLSLVDQLPSILNSRTVGWTATFLSVYLVLLF
jgi:hypothetical protein